MARKKDEDLEVNAEAEAEAKPAEEIDYGSPEQLSIYDSETARIVDEKNELVAELEAAFDEAHATASSRKKRFETTVDELRAIIRERKANRGKAPPKVQATIPFEEAEPKGKLAEVLENLWKEYPIVAERWERFGLTAKDIEKLNAGETKDQGTHPILVYGDVQKFITPNPANPSFARTLKDFKGFGDKGMDRWQEADTAFWAWWSGGGNMEFAAEKGFSNGDATAAGTGGEGAGDGNAGDNGEAATLFIDEGGPAAAESATEPAGEADAEAAVESKPKRGRRKAA